MSDMALDTRTGDIVETEAPASTEAAATEQPEKPAKVKAQPHACACAGFEVGDGTDDGTYTTGCDATTMRTFAQGHDARLVSFLVDAQYDGYPIRRVGTDGGMTNYATAAEAAGSVSEALRDKAAKAIDNRNAKREAVEARKAEREAAKAAKAEEKRLAKEAKAAEKAAAKEAPADGPKDVAVNVVEQAGPARIKVGRREYDAVVDENGVATYADKDGVEQTIERDGYRILSNA